MVRYYSLPRRPTDNPESERFNQTLQVEWLAAGNDTPDVATLNQTLAEWLATYNAIRPHHSLGLRPPIVVAQQTGMVSERSPAATGLQATYISDIERRVRNPTYEVLVELAAALEVQLSRVVKRAER